MRRSAAPNGVRLRQRAIARPMTTSATRTAATDADACAAMSSSRSFCEESMMVSSSTATAKP